MSRTEKTTPLWARIERDPAHLATAHHDHSLGACDLPDHPEQDNLVSPSTHCYWKPSDQLLFGADTPAPTDAALSAKLHHQALRHARHQAHSETHRLETLSVEELLEQEAALDDED